MPDALTAVVVAIFILAVSVWIGGYVAIAVVARIARSALDAGARIALFRRLGRAYLRVGLPALIIAYVTGLILALEVHWGALMIVTVVVAAVLLVSLLIAVGQARRMTVLRRTLMSAPDDVGLQEQIRRGARSAGLLRALLGVLSVALVFLGAFVAV